LSRGSLSLSLSKPEVRNEIYLNRARKNFSSYLAVNVVWLGYKNRKVDLCIEIANRCLFRYLYKVRTRQTMYVYRTIEVRSCNNCCSGKTDTSLASRMQRAGAILSPVAFPALQYFSTLSHKIQYFWGEKKLYSARNVCFDFL